MSEFSKALSLSSSALNAQSTRLRHVSENISNLDTPGYRRKVINFESTLAPESDISLVSVGPVRLDDSEPEKIFDPAHPLADASGHYAGSNVDLIIEIADAREAQRNYEANLKIFDQTRQMSASLMELLKK